MASHSSKLSSRIFVLPSARCASLPGLRLSSCLRWLWVSARILRFFNCWMLFGCGGCLFQIHESWLKSRFVVEIMDSESAQVTTILHTLYGSKSARIRKAFPALLPGAEATKFR